MKAHATESGASNNSTPFMASIAACASFFSAYSMNAYPLTNPVRRSRFRWRFLMSPKSAKASWTSSSCASSCTPSTTMIHPSTERTGSFALPPASSPSTVSYSPLASSRSCVERERSYPRPCARAVGRQTPSDVSLGLSLTRTSEQTNTRTSECDYHHNVPFVYPYPRPYRPHRRAHRPKSVPPRAAP